MAEKTIDCARCGAANPLRYSFCHCCKHTPRAQRHDPAPAKKATKKRASKKR